MIRIAFALALGACLLVSGPAGAFVHLWDISEVYSSPDGTVQFIELFVVDSGGTEIEFGSTRLVALSGPAIFDLPSERIPRQLGENHRLVAFVNSSVLAGGQTPEQKFVDLGGPSPDVAFEVAEPFFALGGDKLCFRNQALDNCFSAIIPGEVEVHDGFSLWDIVEWIGSPTDFDGNSAWHRTGVVGGIHGGGGVSLVGPLELLPTNSPTNYAAQTGTIALPEPSREAALGVTLAVAGWLARRRSSFRACA